MLKSETRNQTAGRCPRTNQQSTACNFGFRNWFGFRFSEFGFSTVLALPLAALLLATACYPGYKPEGLTPLGPPATSHSASSTNALAQSCLLCHGTREMQRGPVIDGLPAWYLEQQLRKFMTGVRGQNPTNKSEHLMGAGISLLKSDADLDLAVRLFSERPPQQHLKTIRGDMDRGRQLFTHCATCHGFDGRGREDAKAPPLTVQEDWYLQDQLVRFKAGLRGATPADLEGFLMHQAVQGLNTQDFRDVVSYVNDELAGRAPASDGSPSPR